jgi:hypothetical protein
VTAPFAPSKDFSRMLDDNSSLLVDDVVHKVRGLRGRAWG